MQPVNNKLMPLYHAIENFDENLAWEEFKKLEKREKSLKDGESLIYLAQRNDMPELARTIFACTPKDFYQLNSSQLIVLSSSEESSPSRLAIITPTNLRRSNLEPKFNCPVMPDPHNDPVLNYTAIPVGIQGRIILNQEFLLPSDSSEAQLDHLDDDDQKTWEESTSDAITNSCQSNVHDSTEIAVNHMNDGNTSTELSEEDNAKWAEIVERILRQQQS